MNVALLQALAGPVSEVLDKVITTPEEKARVQLELFEGQIKPYLAQLEVNKVEAANPRLFISGWRPFIGWVCGSIFVWNYIVAPMLHWLLLMFGQDIPVIPTLGMEEVMPVLLGLLGLGGMRTFEKAKGVEGNR